MHRSRRAVLFDDFVGRSRESHRHVSLKHRPNAKVSMWSRIGNAGMSHAGSLLRRPPFTFLIGLILFVVATAGGYLY
jgi:hypothetical protein